MARSLVTVALPVGEVAVIIPWRDLAIQPWSELLRPLAELVGSEGAWSARPLAADESDRHALVGY